MPKSFYQRIVCIGKKINSTQGENMRKCILSTIICSSLFVVLSSSAILASEGEMFLPESLEARTQMAAGEKTLTVFIEEDDPKKAVELLNQTNAHYAEQGWYLFSVNPYNDSSFEGFFVTYQKKTMVF